MASLLSGALRKVAAGSRVKAMAKELALFGGTFDPVHFGHLITARAVAEQCGFERIHLLPAARPPHKEPARVAAEHRLAMLELAVRDDRLFEICRIELDRAGPNYTLETLTELRRQHGQETELYWIIGADMLTELHTWHRAQEVVDMAQIVVAARPPLPARVAELLGESKRRFRPNQVQRIEEFFISTPLVDISSTGIRKRLAEGRSIRYLVPEEVRTYIETKGLYR